MLLNRRNGSGALRLTAAVTIGALVLALVGLTVANARQGPRLLDAQINPGAVVEGAPGSGSSYALTRPSLTRPPIR
jgi:hypothetical protein